mgnify:FL=1
MTDIRRILFATDFSEASHNAQAMAAQLARHHQAELHVVHAEVIPATAYVPEMVVDLDALTTSLHEAAEAQMAKLVDRIGLPVRHALVSGFDAATVIRDYADEAEIDLIVVGSHGRSGLGKLFMGSDAQGVVRLSKRAVLVVNAHSAPQAGGFGHLLAPVDLSPASAQSLQAAAALARHYQGRLSVIHVVEEWPIPPYYAHRFEQAQVEHGTAALEAFLKDHPVTPEANTLVLGGTPATQIVDQARQLHADLIVLARGGLGDWEHFLLGSVTERVMAQAPCSVWICETDRRAQ